MKKCTKCNMIKSFDDFHNTTTTKDGFTYNCKQCIAIYRNSNKEKNRLYQAERRITNNDLVCEQKNKSYQNSDPRKKILNGLKDRAKRKGLNYNINIDDIVIPNFCPYLKVPFLIGKKNDYQYTYSIDRIDNSRGYEKGNVEIVSMKANSMKNNATKTELINFAIEILTRFKDDDIVRTALKNVELQDKEPVR